MLNTNPIRRQFPYYGSYAGFYRVMRELKEKGLPRRIETRNFGPALKNEAARIAAGFSALGWTDETGKPTEDLSRLVRAFGESSWGSVLSEIVPKAYAFLNGIDLESASNNDLKNAFVSYAGRDAEALRSAETFFLCLAAEAGRPMSEGFARRASRGVGDARRWLKLAQTGLLDDDVAKAFGIDEPEKAKTSWSDDMGVFAAKIIDLTALLSEGDMTDKEKEAVVVLLSYLGRRLKREGS